MTYGQILGKQKIERDCRYDLRIADGRYIMQDKRRSRRYVVEPFDIKGRMMFANVVRIVDIGLSGALLKSDRRLGIEREYSLEIEYENRIIQLKGVVKWSVLSELRKDAHGDRIPIYKGGMKFTDVSDERIKELTDFMEAGNPEGSIPEEMQQAVLRHVKRLDVTEQGRAVLRAREVYKIRKLSLSGMLIDCGQELEMGKELPLEISLPKNKTVRLVGRVAYCLKGQGKDNSGFGVGIEFVDISERDRKSINEFLNLLDKGDCCVQFLSNGDG